MANVEFLSNNCLEAVRTLIEENEESILAVSYWGDDAIGQLGLDRMPRAKQAKITIVCDLLSGACNPHVIRELCDKYDFVVKKLSKLHAKVYWTPRAVIVGSSNASATGLGFEGKELLGNIEASAKIIDEDFVQTSKMWLDREVLARCSPVNNRDLKIADERWASNRSKRPKEYKNLSEFFADPDSLKDRAWEAVVLTQKISPGAIKVRNQAKKDFGKDMDGIELFDEECPFAGWVIAYWVVDGKVLKKNLESVFEFQPSIIPRQSRKKWHFHFAVRQKKKAIDGIILDQDAITRIVAYLNSDPEIVGGKRARIPLYEIAIQR